ncbi:hypothetical protein BDY19DRAFT_910430 [Irpex rosettiformis]|uniref:Uncharacterized protein n=1 Tax=Irpex rosettiformis TaxID=378272 RepID=A0ACB8TNS2_9APHY|nr:hypothetical protein BDY19DRAFT_910430 [Irpex rosettiformis]
MPQWDGQNEVGQKNKSREATVALPGVIAGQCCVRKSRETLRQTTASSSTYQVEARPDRHGVESGFILLESDTAKGHPVINSESSRRAQYCTEPTTSTHNSSHLQSRTLSIEVMLNYPVTPSAPVLLWASNDDVPGFPGLYVSLNVSHLPAMDKSHYELTAPTGSRSPWKWFFTRFADQLHYWTALSLTKPDYTGLLQPLQFIQIDPLLNGSDLCFQLRNADEWQHLEDFLRRVLELMKTHYLLSNLTPLLVQVECDAFPWPSAFYYTARWPSRETAKRALLTARASFALAVTKLTYASHLLPLDWVEGLLCHDTITPDEAYQLRSSPICQNTDPVQGVSFNRAGLVVNVTRAQSTSNLEEISVLIEKFSLPAWIYYGLEPKVSDHAWSARYLPAQYNVDACRRNMKHRVADTHATMDWDARTMIRDWDMYNLPVDTHAMATSSQATSTSAWGSYKITSTSEPSPVPTSAPPSTWQPSEPPPFSEPPPSFSEPSPSFSEPSPSFSEPSSSFSKSPPSFSEPPPPSSEPPPPFLEPPPRRDPVTRQLPGETPEHFFNYVDKEIEKHLSRMGTLERAVVEARRQTYMALPVPDRSHKCRVWVWIEDDGRWTRTIAGHRRWLELFLDSSATQRRYDPVRNEFDICEALDPDGEGEGEEMWHYEREDAERVYMGLPADVESYGAPSSLNSRPTVRNKRMPMHRSIEDTILAQRLLDSNMFVPTVGIDLAHLIQLLLITQLERSNRRALAVTEARHWSVGLKPHNTPHQRTTIPT